MGTNYYAVFNKCEHCGREDRLHIGKSSAGWPFTFRGYPDEEVVGEVIDSLEKWRHFLRRKGAEIVTEYGEWVPICDFLDKVYGKQKTATNFPDPNELEHLSLRKWQDPQGHYFSGYEFS